MATSKIPGIKHHDASVFSPIPARTPGICGILDQGDITICTLAGDSGGPVGFEDHGMCYLGGSYGQALQAQKTIPPAGGAPSSHSATQPTTQPGSWDGRSPPSWPAFNANRATRERFGIDMAMYFSKWAKEHPCCVPDPITLAAQWMMESNWGRSSLTQATNNLGNIKGTGPAGTTKANTLEILGGKSVTVNAGFRKYHNLGEFFQDYTDLICKDARYANARGKSGRAYFQALRNAGYATDTDYVNKAMQFFHQLGGAK